MTQNACYFCEGSKYHFGKECGACDGTGIERVRKQLVKVYNAKNNLPLNTTIWDTRKMTPA